MPTVRKSALVSHRPEAMFELVEDVEQYPRFLPWCASTEVYERTPQVTRARLDIAYGGLRTHITTRNTKDPPHGMTLEFVDGPFERFRAQWRFVALGDTGCRVEFSLDYDLASAPLRALLGPLFGHVADTMVERFIERADALAARPPRPKGR
ncbi:MAG TPA: type II toxin-antitoxin system RatA family toxin [Usitatibacter sp.]|jgi:ribosome-associated toxin RatA of RatAB toxin-antitoxin module|nr:type II toxin-antitoxin system RatA family toxin [Usitatibacter sp.]